MGIMTPTDLDLDTLQDNKISGLEKIKSDIKTAIYRLRESSDNSGGYLLTQLIALSNRLDEIRPTANSDLGRLEKSMSELERESSSIAQLKTDIKERKSKVESQSSKFKTVNEDVESIIFKSLSDGVSEQGRNDFLNIINALKEIGIYHSIFNEEETIRPIQDSDLDMIISEIFQNNPSINITNSQFTEELKKKISDKIGSLAEETKSRITKVNNATKGILEKLDRVERLNKIVSDPLFIKNIKHLIDYLKVKDFVRGIFKLPDIEKLGGINFGSTLSAQPPIPQLLIVNMRTGSGDNLGVDVLKLLGQPLKIINNSPGKSLPGTATEVLIPAVNDYFSDNYKSISDIDFQSIENPVSYFTELDFNFSDDEVNLFAEIANQSAGLSVSAVSKLIKSIIENSQNMELMQLMTLGGATVTLTFIQNRLANLEKAVKDLRDVTESFNPEKSNENLISSQVELYAQIALNRAISKSRETLLQQINDLESQYIKGANDISSLISDISSQIYSDEFDEINEQILLLPAPSQDTMTHETPTSEPKVQSEASAAILTTIPEQKLSDFQSILTQDFEKLGKLEITNETSAILDILDSRMVELRSQIDSTISEFGEHPELTRMRKATETVQKIISLKRSKLVVVASQ